MAKRLLFVLMFIPFTIFIILVMAASLIYWMFTGEGLLYLIDWGKEKMNDLIK